jgi:hypothetical protein
MKLDDQFEWDLENVDASPEQFAEVYAKELGLGGEFKCVGLNVHDFATDVSICLERPLRIPYGNKSKSIKSRYSSLVIPPMGHLYKTMI